MDTVVRHRKPWARGGKVAGQAGREYQVADTGLLHRRDGAHVVPEPGCDAVDAAYLLRFPEMFAADSAPPPAPPPAPPAEPVRPPVRPTPSPSRRGRTRGRNH